MPAKSTRYEVLLTDGAGQDLESIHDHVAAFDSPENADRLLDHLIEVAESLARFPERGSHPKELLALGIKAYRHTFFASYRVIYRVMGGKVTVVLIVDGRRDMASVLARRLLGA